MRKRNNRIVVHLSDDELETLAEKMKKSHLSREAFIRASIAGTEVKEVPDIDVPGLIQEIRHVGININQIARTANSLGMIDAPQFRKELLKLHEVENHIVEAFINGGS